MWKTYNLQFRKLHEELQKLYIIHNLYEFLSTFKVLTSLPLFHYSVCGMEFKPYRVVVGTVMKCMCDVEISVI